MMTDTFIIDLKSGLPKVGYLSGLLKEYRQVNLQYESLPEGYISLLTYSFPDYTVFNRASDQNIFIFPSIPNSVVLEKKQELYDCAKAFRKNANQLMNLMCKTFGINLETLDGLYELNMRKSDKQRGRLNGEWIYHLHGAECRFENAHTGQVVEVIITTRPEFGYLDCYFFYTYMATTEPFKSLADFFNNQYQYICKAIDLLALEGVLTRVNTLSSARNVIAL